MKKKDENVTRQTLWYRKKAKDPKWHKRKNEIQRRSNRRRLMRAIDALPFEEKVPAIIRRAHLDCLKTWPEYRRRYNAIVQPIRTARGQRERDRLFEKHPELYEIKKKVARLEAQRNVHQVTDKYVYQLIASSFHLSMTAIPPGLFELYRQYIILRRLVRERTPRKNSPEYKAIHRAEVWIRRAERHVEAVFTRKRREKDPEYLENRRLQNTIRYYKRMKDPQYRAERNRKKRERRAALKTKRKEVTS